MIFFDFGDHLKRRMSHDEDPQPPTARGVTLRDCVREPLVRVRTTRKPLPPICYQDEPSGAPPGERSRARPGGMHSRRVRIARAHGSMSQDSVPGYVLRDDGCDLGECAHSGEDSVCVCTCQR